MAPNSNHTSQIFQSLPADIREAVLAGKYTMSFRLEKFEGDPPREGEDKKPFEVITGGDDQPTLITHPTE